MTASPHSPTLDQHMLTILRKVHAGACVLLIALGIAVLIGWALDIELLKSFGGRFVSMKPNAALGFAVAGLALWFRRETNDHNYGAQRLALGLGAIVVTLGALTLLEYFADWDIGIDQLLFRDAHPLFTSNPGRMSINTSIGFCFAGAALLLLETRAAQWLTAAAALPALMSMVGYIYDAEQLVGLLTFTAMSPYAIAGMLALSAGLLCARPASGAIAWFTSSGPQGLLVRQLLPGGIAILLGVGLITNYGHTGGLYGVEYRAAIQLVAIIVLLCALVLRAAAVLARVEAARALTEQTFEAAAVRLHATVETVVDGIITIGERGTIETVNPAVTRLFGYAAREMIGRNVSMLMPESDRSRHDGYLEHFRSTGERRIIGIGREVQGRRKDGAEFPLHLAISEMRVDERRMFTGVVRDITERKRAEEELRESEQRFRQLIEGLPQLVWTCRVEGPCDYLSPQWVRYTGIPEAEQLGYGWLQPVHPEDRQGLTDAWGQAVTANLAFFETEFRIRGADRIYRWFKARAVPLRDENGSAVKWFGTNTDIDDQKRVEVALRDSEKRIRLIVDSALDAVVTMNESGMVTGWNSQAEVIFGWKREDALNRPLGDLIIPDAYREAHRRGLAQLLETGQATVLNKRLELNALHKEGQTFPIELTIAMLEFGAGKEFSAFVRDITERKQFEEALRESEERLRFTLEATLVGQWDLDLVTDTARRSLRHDEIFGYDSLLPQWDYDTFLKHVHPDDRIYADQLFRDAVAGGKSWDFECRIVRADGVGRWIWVKGSIFHSLTAGGKPRRMVGLVMDITERKQAEQALRRQHEEEAALQATRAALTEKTVLLNEIHHRVKNNLQIIAGLLHLQAASTSDGTIKAALAEGKSRVETMALVHQLLYETGDFSEIRLSVYLQRLMDLLVSGYCVDPARIRIRLEVDDARLDLNRLIPIGLLVHELLCNAFKHAFPAGCEGEIKVELRENAADGTVTLTVSDTGVGLPAGLVPKKAKTLGLKLVGMLADQIGGTLTIGSGPGTRFDLHFPSATQRRAA